MDVEKQEELLKILQDKIFYFRKGLVKESDTSTKFKLESEIKETEQEEAQLRRALAEAYDLRSPSGAGILREAISNLSFKKRIGSIHRLNCNRKEMIDKFWSYYDQFPANGVQFFFVSACPTQMPHCFSERAVEEVLIEELERTLDALHIKRNPVDERLEIYGLPMGRNLSRSQRAFNKFLSRHFGLGDAESPGSFFRRALQGTPYKYAAIVFRMNEGQWGKDFPAYFRWIVESLSQAPAPGVRILLFFAVKIEGLHLPDKPSPDQRAIAATFDRLAEEYEAVAHLSPLKPVPEKDLLYWFDEIIEGNLAKAEEVIKGFIRSLSPEDQQQYKEEGLFNMDDIDQLQEVVFEMVNK